MNLEDETLPSRADVMPSQINADTLIKAVTVELLKTKTITAEEIAKLDRRRLTTDENNLVNQVVDYFEDQLSDLPPDFKDLVSSILADLTKPIPAAAA